jgi:hypothetical protein
MVSPFHGKAIQRRSVEPIFFVLNNNRYVSPNGCDVQTATSSPQ